jgi:thioredoxin reductase
VVGGGDTAVSEALTLRRLCRRVTLVVRRSNLSASLPMQTKFWQSGIDIIRDAEVTDVIGIQLRNVLTGDFRVLNVAALFVAIGRVPRLMCLTVTAADAQKICFTRGYMFFKFRNIVSTVLEPIPS